MIIQNVTINRKINYSLCILENELRVNCHSNISKQFKSKAFLILSKQLCNEKFML